jgi:uncharacterized cupredoxin-like copper-binding protein
MMKDPVPYRVAKRNYRKAVSMPRLKSTPMLVSMVLGAALVAGCSSSSSTKSPSTTAAPGGGVTVPTAGTGTTVNVTVSDTSGLNGPMTLVPSVASVSAGDVSFAVKNTGTIDHEMIVLKTATPFDQLPVVDGGDPPAPVTSGADKVDEANNVGETGDPNLKPGESRTFTIKALAPGSYVLVCNIAKHYGLGMRAAFTVK